MKKAAVIGLGDISMIHLLAVQANPEITLVAVCDTDVQAAQAAKKAMPFLEEVPCFTDYKEMVRTAQPDCVHICLPHFLHYPVSRDIAEMGVNVFCEKPVALNTAEALAFAAVEAANPNVKMGICLQNRVNESVEMLKEIIESERYGKVTGCKGLVPWARPKEYYDVKPWRGKWETAGGGCMINQSVHTLDLLYYLCGDIESLTGSATQLLDYGIEVEDTVTARLQFANGATGVFWATNANATNESVQITVQLEKATFTILENVLYQVAEDGTKTRLCEDARMEGSKFYYGASHSKIIAQFYRAIENNTNDYIHVKDAVMSIRLIDAVQNSSREGNRVETIKQS